MNKNIKKNENDIAVHQCLFGYQNGHRLLATSLQLPEEAAATLLLLSDLTPGLVLPVNGGYWTGIPLPAAKSYALMFTWLAPEMPRPGCVWTHVLIVAFSDIARFPDLSVLSEHMTRPEAEIGFEIYCTPITLASPSVTSAIEMQTVPRDVTSARQVVHAIYAEQGTGKVISPMGEMDDTIFAVWSQQWPRLRRSFSFRTASKFDNSLSRTNRFDLLVLLVPNQDYNNLANDKADNLEEWEKTCINDLLFPHSTEFRRFLWRYGSDVRQGRKRFELLANVYIATRSERLNGSNLNNILETIIRGLAAPDEGKVLKDDLIGSNQYSLLPSTDPFDVFSLFVNNSIVNKLSLQFDKLFDALKSNWPNRAEELFSIAETAATHETELGTKILDWLAAVTDASTFLASTATRPNLRKKLLMLNPSLLDSDDLIKFTGAELLKLVKHLPDDDQLIIDHILLRLMSVDDTTLALEMVGRFPDSAIATAIAVTEECLARGDGAAVPQSWVKAIGEQSSTVLEGGFIERAHTTSTLSFLAATLGYLQPETLQAGPIPWAKGIKNARDDLRNFDRQKFLVFLLELALHHPVSGCEPLFEIAFDSVHSDLRHSKLSWTQMSQLLQFLPNLGWFKNWDNCLRLRFGIVDAYVTHKLSPNSFHQLTVNTGLYDDLVKLAVESKEGRKFIKQIVQQNL